MDYVFNSVNFSDVGVVIGNCFDSICWRWIRCWYGCIEVLEMGDYMCEIFVVVIGLSIIDLLNIGWN